MASGWKHQTQRYGIGWASQILRMNRPEMLQLRNLV
jgi:hypothetical protein